MNHPRNPHPNANLPSERAGNDGSMIIYDPNANGPQVDDEIDLRSLWRIVVRYRKLIMLIFLIVVSVAAVTNYLKRPEYTASGLIEINIGGRNLIKFQNLETERISSREHISTQTKILSSKTLAEEVVSRLKLMDEPEFTGELRQRNIGNGLKALQNLIRPEQTVLSDAQKSRRAINYYRSRLSISPVRNSTLVNIRFESFDRDLASRIVNEHMQAYVWLSGERRIQSTSGAKDFLESQIAKAQAKLGESEQRLTDFARENRVIDMEDHNNIVITRLSKLNDSLLSVQNDRIDAETQFVQSNDADPMQLAFVNEDSLIKSLQEERSKLQSRYLELSKIYKPKYPELRELDAKIAETDVAIDKRARNIVGGLENSFRQLQAREAQIKDELEKAKGELFDLKDRSVNYNIYKREWEANKELYAGLLERTKEVGVAAGMELNVASVVDQAVRPGSSSSLSFSLSLLLAAMGGLLGGIAVAFLLAMLDNTVSDVEQLHKITHLEHLGVVPSVKNELKSVDKDKRSQLMDTFLHHYPCCVFSESIQSIRASLSYAAADRFPKSILVTSSVAGEGKSTIAMNLALACANSGKRTVIVDADLRCPGYDTVFNVPSSPGLTDYLTNEVSITPYGIEGITNLALIVSGSDVHNPSDLLSARKMRRLIQRLEKDYDTVIIDSPPILGLADSVMLSTLVQSVLLVVEARSTPQDAIKGAIQRLRMVSAPISGTVLTRTEPLYSEYSERYFSDSRMRAVA